MAAGQRQTIPKTGGGDRVPTPGPYADTEPQHRGQFKPKMPTLAEQQAGTRWPDVVVAGNTERPVFKIGG